MICKCSNFSFIGQIDYLGQDSFENIQKKIDETMSTEVQSSTPVTTSSPFTPKTAGTAAEVKPKPVIAVASKTTAVKAPAPKVSSGISVSLSSKKK